MDEASPRTLGERIRARRQQLKLSTSELARKSGVQRDTLVAWESGHREPRANKLIMLAGLLGTNVGWLLEGDGGCGPTPTPTNDTAALRQQLGQARDLARNLSNMLESIERRVQLLEDDEDTHG